MNLLRRTPDKRDSFSTDRDLGAFTLIELLLTVALVLMFAGAIILNFGSLDNTARLEEGASHLEALFRYARAQAASSGRQVRIVFGSESTSSVESLTAQTNVSASFGTTNARLQVLWEPDPIEAPGKLEPFPGAELLVDQVNDLVKVREVGQPGAAFGQPGGVSQATSLDPAVMSSLSLSSETNSLTAVADLANSRPPLICYPDGSSDSMQVVVSAVDSQDKRLAVVTLWGLTGATRHRLVSSTNDNVPSSEEVDDYDFDWDL